MDNGPNGELKQFSGKRSGRSSIIEGSKYCRGLIIDLGQILELLHDTHPQFPIPRDAEYRGFDAKDAGVDSVIQWKFFSKSNPNLWCFEQKPERLFEMLKQLSDGLIPLDGYLDGFEVTPNWKYMMLRISSSHWPPPALGDEKMPMYHLRYLAGCLELTDPIELLLTRDTKKIRIQ